MNRLCLALALLACAIFAKEGRAQVLSWSDGFPKTGTQSGTILVQGKIDTTKTNVTKVIVYVYKQGDLKPNDGIPLQYDALNKIWLFRLKHP